MAREHRDFLERVISKGDKVVWAVIRPNGGLYRCTVQKFTKHQVWITEDDTGDLRRTYSDLLIVVDDQLSVNETFEEIREPTENIGSFIKQMEKQGIDALEFKRLYQITGDTDSSTKGARKKFKLDRDGG